MIGALMHRPIKVIGAGLHAFAFGATVLIASLSVSRAADDTITLALGTGSVVRIDRPFATVLIGDPAVVDVRAQDDRSVILRARALGTANIVFVDEASIAIANIRVIVRDAQM